KSRHRIKAYNQRIEDLGLVNPCPWFWMDSDESADEDSIGGYSKEESAVMADRDLSGVREADIFIIDTIDATETGGREVELGAALILGKVIFHVGPIRNLFHMHPGIRNFRTWDNIISYIESTFYQHGGK
ncbi:hypothetical protein LCGC14_2067760, partial [marine sediment metagenome]